MPAAAVQITVNHDGNTLTIAPESDGEMPRSLPCPPSIHTWFQAASGDDGSAIGMRLAGAYVGISEVRKTGTGDFTACVILNEAGVRNLRRKATAYAIERGIEPDDQSISRTANALEKALDQILADVPGTKAAGKHAKREKNRNRRINNKANGLAQTSLEVYEDQRPLLLALAHILRASPRLTPEQGAQIFVVARRLQERDTRFAVALEKLIAKGRPGRFEFDAKREEA